MGQSRVMIGAPSTTAASEVTVEDDGPGIPPERVDEVSLHADAAGRTVPGTGVGLAIVPDLVELHRGHLQLSRSPSGGARVTVHLPGCQTLA